MYIYQHNSFEGPPKYTKIWIFGLKIHVPSGNPGLLFLRSVRIQASNYLADYDENIKFSSFDILR
jgi:hypothetical protein